VYFCFASLGLEWKEPGLSSPACPPSPQVLTLLNPRNLEGNQQSPPHSKSGVDRAWDGAEGLLSTHGVVTDSLQNSQKLRTLESEKCIHHIQT
jgi:hypothetical protein